MIYDPILHALYANDGTFLKTVHCPKALKIRDLLPIGQGSNRFCESCKSEVVHIGDMSDDEVIKLLLDDEDYKPTPCVFAGPAAKNIVFLRHESGTYEPNDGLHVIKTARSIAEMEEGWRDGFWPLMYFCGTPNKIGQHLVVYQNKKNGQIWTSGDARRRVPDPESCSEPDYPWELVFDWFFYRSDHPFPLAAYLLPKNLTVGTKVYLEDVIEDYPDKIGPQGFSKPVCASPAIWDGTKFTLVVPMRPPIVG